MRQFKRLIISQKEHRRSIYTNIKTKTKVTNDGEDGDYEIENGEQDHVPIVSVTDIRHIQQV